MKKKVWRRPEATMVETRPEVTAYSGVDFPLSAPAK
jgi:hypothetical protein